jgi:hypothetical protein
MTVNPNPVGIGAYATPCACSQKRNAVGSNGTLDEATWVLGIGAIVLLGVAAIVVTRSMKEAGF